MSEYISAIKELNSVEFDRDNFGGTTGYRIGSIINGFHSVTSGLTEDIDTYNRLKQKISDAQSAFDEAVAGGANKKKLELLAESLQGAKDDYEGFFEAIKKNSKALGAYLGSLDGAKGSLKGFREYCKANSIELQQFSIKSKAATLALKGLSVAGSALLSLGVSLVISALINGIISLATHTKRVRQEAEAAADTYRDQTESLSAYQAEVKSINDSLSSGTLSTEETYDARQRLVEIQREMLSTYGAEASSLDLLAMSADEAAEAFHRLAVKQAETFLKDNAEGFSDAKQAMEQITEREMVFRGTSKPKLDDRTRNAIARAGEGLDAIKLEDTGAVIEVELYANASDMEEQMDTFKNRLEQLGVGLSNIKVAGTTGGAYSNLEDTIDEIIDKA